MASTDPRCLCAPQDYLPTFLDVAGIAHENPSWPADGISLMPFIRQTQASTAVDVVANRTKPLGFRLGKQQAWIDNEWKVVRNPNKGQCKNNKGARRKCKATCSEKTGEDLCAL